MKHPLPLCLLILLGILLGSCKDATNKKSTIDATDRLATPISFDTLVMPHAPKRITRNIKLDNDGNLLIASYDDVIRYDGTTFNALEKPEGTESWYAFDALQDRKGNIWIASDQSGAYGIDATTGAITHYTPEDGLGNRRNMCVFEDSNGAIWIGGQGGLSQFDGTGFVTYTTDDGLPHNDINTIMEDSKGNLWFGTRGNAGIYDGTTFRELKNESGEPFFNSWSIMEDSQGIIWLIDSKGLWKFQEGQFSFITTDVWKSYEDNSNTFWFTGMQPGASTVIKKINARSLIENPSSMEEVLLSKTMLFCLVEGPDSSLWIGGSDGVWRYNGTSATYFTGIVNLDN